MLTFKTEIENLHLCVSLPTVSLSQIFLLFALKTAQGGPRQVFVWRITHDCLSVADVNCSVSSCSCRFFLTVNFMFLSTETPWFHLADAAFYWLCMSWAGGWTNVESLSLTGWVDLIWQKSLMDVYMCDCWRMLASPHSQSVNESLKCFV